MMGNESPEHWKAIARVVLALVPPDERKDFRDWLMCTQENNYVRVAEQLSEWSHEWSRKRTIADSLMDIGL